ncbi:MAG: hypothetical protein V1779_00320, partial [bacterium]
MKKYIMLLILLLLTNTCFVLSQDNALEVESIRFQISDYEYNPWAFGEEISGDKYFEILAGWHAIRPVVVVKNNSNEFKELKLNVRIVNQVTGRPLYNKYFFIGDTILGSDEWFVEYFYYDSTGDEILPPFDTNTWALPPKSSIKVELSPFVPNDLFDSNYGRLIVKAVLTEYKDSIEVKSYDTVYSKINVIGRVEDLPWEHFKTYIDTTDTNDKLKYIFPDDRFWGSSGVEIVDGTTFCHNTNLGYSTQKNTIKWDTMFTQGHPEGILHTYQDSLITNLRPVFRLNRVNEKRNEYGTNGRFGDTLISGVLDLKDKSNVKIIIECQRSGKLPIAFDRNWADKTLYGPEHRVILNGDCYSEYREPDKLIVELAFSNNLYELMNPSDTIWNRLRDSKSGELYQGEPALILFGGGGSYSGLPKKGNPDSIPGLNCDLLDNGKDNEFHNYHIYLPDYMLNKEKGGYVRIRFRVDAKKHGNGFVHDDYDDFFIQNVYTVFYSHFPDYDVSNINIVNPYSIIPKLRNIRLPVVTHLSRLSDSSQNMSLFVKIKNLNEVSKDEYETHPKYDPGYLFGTNYYYRGGQVFPSNFEYKLHSMPNIYMYKLDGFPYHGNVQLLKQCLIEYPNDDSNPENNNLYSTDELNFGDVYAYDKAEEQNDVEIESEGDVIGLSLPGNADGFATWENSYGSHSESGQIAIRFQSYGSPDTIYGFQAYFPDVYQSPNTIGFSIYMNNANNLPGDLITSSVMIRKTEYDELSKENKNSGYITYLYGSDYDTLQEPLQLDYGTYWLAIAQYDETPLNLGASGYRMGMITTNYDMESNGANGTNILIEDCWKLLLKDDNRLIQ